MECRGLQRLTGDAVPDYYVIDYVAGRPAADLTAFLNAAGAQGWRLRDIDMKRHDTRRSVFIKGEAMAEYLVVDYDTGLTSDELEADLDGYGATGWELVHVDMLAQTRRRGILMRINATEKQTFVYRFSTSNTPPAASGYILIDNDDPTLASGIYISCLTDGGTDVSNYLTKLLINDKIYIQDQNNANDYYLFHLIAPPQAEVIQPGNYVAYPVAFDERGLTNLANNATVAVVMGTNVAISGGGGGGGGIPDAPTDGVTYGRKDAAWNASLALNNDILDGGNF